MVGEGQREGRARNGGKAGGEDAGGEQGDHDDSINKETRQKKWSKHGPPSPSYQLNGRECIT